MRLPFALGFVAISAIGCASHSPLPEDTTNNLGIEKVSISISPDAPLKVGQDMDCGDLSQRACVAKQLRSDLQRTVQRRLNGDRSAELIVGVVSMEIEGTARQVLVGSGHKLTFLAQIVDSESREVIATSNAMNVGVGYNRGGIISVALDAVSRDPIVRLSEEMTEEVCVWLDADCDL